MDPVRNQQRTGATGVASSSRAYPVASWSSFSSTASPVGSLSQTPVQVEHRPGGSVVGWPATTQAARLAFTPPQPRSFPWPCVMSPVALANGRVLVHTPPSSSTADADSPNPGCLTPSRQVVCTVARQTTPAPASTMSFTAARGLMATQAVPGITMSVSTLSSQSTASPFMLKFQLLRLCDLDIPTYESAESASQTLFSCLLVFLHMRTSWGSRALLHFRLDLQFGLQRRSVCCLLPGAGQSGGKRCPVREASWESFRDMRRKSRQHDFFVGCEVEILREYHQWQPSKLAAICIELSRLRPEGHVATDRLLQCILWRAEHLVQQLSGLELLSLMEAFALRQIREHDSRCPDFFGVASGRLRDEVKSLHFKDLRRATAMYKQLNIRDEGLFQAFGKRLAELLEASTALSVQSGPRPKKGQSRGEEGAVMAFLNACGRLNIQPPEVDGFFKRVGPAARARKDVPRLVALAQLAAKFGIASTREADRILTVVCAAFEGNAPSSKGYASQAITGQLLLALIFDESACETRDRALVAAVGAVNASFGCNLKSLDEQLARQLQVTELACRLERPVPLHMLELKGLGGFLEGVRCLEQSVFGPLPKSSSQQHLQVSGALQELGVQHRTEERLDPYIADVRLTTNQSLIEIDGPLHFVGSTQRYDMKSSLKHRLLTKQGWHVHHIAWNDWPEHHHSRMSYIARLLRRPPPGKHLLQYTPLQPSICEEHADRDLVEQTS
ncbi:unnamed protein product [Symbiodinium necroappetens]|uniref:RAP domain-containing protein n=1 Tax=Symbiodinium necroappetens TaxID=1628268 RepID=A0A812IVY6_9DINO|nr:unnamed protein product [Symbiodinium necroappetens]